MVTIGSGGVVRLQPVEAAAQAILQVVDSANPPLKLPLGESALNKVRAKIAGLQAELAEWERFTLDAEKVNIPSR